MMVVSIGWRRLTCVADLFRLPGVVDDLFLLLLTREAEHLILACTRFKSADRPFRSPSNLDKWRGLSSRGRLRPAPPMQSL